MDVLIVNLFYKIILGMNDLIATINKFPVKNPIEEVSIPDERNAPQVCK